MLREVEEEIGLLAETKAFVGVYPFERLNQLIFVYHLHADDGEIRLCETELADYKLVPIEKLRPWSRGTGPAVRDWLAARGLYPEVIEFGDRLSRRERQRGLPDELRLALAGRDVVEIDHPGKHAVRR